MADVTALLASNRAAVDEMLKVAEQAQSNWTTPRAPGKWSPQQVLEHVAIAYEEGGNVITGQPTKLPTLPALVRPLARMMFNRAVKTGKFPKARTNKEMDPARSSLAGPVDIAAARARLDAALAKFDEACRSRAAQGDQITSGAFGRVSLADYARFTELHTRHHTKQIPTASA